MDKRWPYALVAIGILVFAKPHMALSVYGGFDPHCFVENLYRLIGHPYPSCGPNDFFSGLAWIWFPLATLTYGAAWVVGVHPHHPVLASILVTSAGAWTLAVWFIHQTLREAKTPSGPRTSLWWALGIALSFPALYYGFVRPTLAHAPEFALSAALPWLLLRKRAGWALFIAAALFSLRPQNAWAVLWVAVVLAERQSKAGRVALVAGLICLGWAAIKMSLSHYHHVTLAFLWSRLTWAHVTEVLWGSDWGLVWTAPGWLWVWVRGLSPASWGARASWLVLTAHLLLVAAWRGNGGDFGYRYLIATVGPTLWLWCEIRPRWNRLCGGVIAAGACWMLWLTWIYRSTPATFPRPPSPGWSPTLPHYQWTALEGLADPTQWIAPLHTSLPVTAVCALLDCRSHALFQSTTLIGLCWGLISLCGLGIWWSWRRRPLTR